MKEYCQFKKFTRLRVQNRLTLRKLSYFLHKMIVSTIYLQMCYVYPLMCYARNFTTLGKRRVLDV